MARPSRRDVAKEQFWRKAIARFSVSKLSKSDFCRREGLDVDHLRYWTNTISERDKALPLTEPVQDNANDKIFLPVVVAGDSHKANRVPGTKQMAVAEIVFGEGSVFLFNGVTQQTVRALRLGMGEDSE